MYIRWSTESVTERDDDALDGRRVDIVFTAIRNDGEIMLELYMRCILRTKASRCDAGAEI